MKNTNRTGVITIVIIVLLIIVFVAVRAHRAPVTGAPTGTETSTPIATATYACMASKTITASYYDGAATPAASADMPPTPGGSVALTLSDGRTMTLPQTISADGGRYANADESVVFWNKGNGITFTEGGQQTYMGCIQLAKDPGGLPLSYENGPQGFSLRYPTGYTVDDSYKYQALGPGKDIGGVKFTIPASLASGTNLSDDSYVSVEEITGASACSAASFLMPGSTVTTTTDADGTTYSMGTSSDAGAGNRYEETVYALPGTNPCMAVRYYIHYGAIENYPAGAVQEFDKAALTAQFDAIRKTLVVLGQQ